MKKTIILLFSITIIITSITYTNAKSIYFTNDNKVNLTKEEYEFINEIFYNGYQNIMTLDDYNDIFSEDILNSEIEIKTIDNNSFQPLSDVHTTKSKTIKIAKACATNCLISVTVNWSKSPVIRSYDVIGARMENTSIIEYPKVTITNTSGTTRSEDIDRYNNGFGMSIKLLSSGDDMIINQRYYVSKGGRVYASYQHATKSITLNNSKKYTISSNGYGGVFLFDSSVKDIYDKMQGVYIDV